MHYKRYYIENSYIFITIVTYYRNHFLLNHIDLLKQAFKYTKTKYEFSIIAISVLKDHIHLIIYPQNITDYPNIIKTFKAYFSKNIDVNQIPNYIITESKLRKNEKGIWQSRYWAHVIIDEKDLYKHLDYIHYNSMKHYNIVPKDWQYSSFKNYVKKSLYDINWYNANDKNKIANLNLE